MSLCCFSWSCTSSCDMERSLGLECPQSGDGDRHFIPPTTPGTGRHNAQLLQEGLHHHGQSPSLLSNTKFLLPGDGVHMNPPILADGSIDVPAKYLAPREQLRCISFGARSKEQAGLLQVVPSTGLLLSLLSSNFRRFLAPVFIYVSEVYIVWRLVWAAGCSSWKKVWWSQCRMSSQSCFVEISLAGDLSVFLQGLEPAQQPGFFTVSGSLAVDLCRT